MCAGLNYPEFIDFGGPFEGGGGKRRGSQKELNSGGDGSTHCDMNAMILAVLESGHHAHVGAGHPEQRAYSALATHPKMSTNGRPGRVHNNCNGLVR